VKEALAFHYLNMKPSFEFYLMPLVKLVANQTISQTFVYLPWTAYNLRALYGACNKEPQYSGFTTSISRYFSM